MFFYRFSRVWFCFAVTGILIVCVGAIVSPETRGEDGDRAPRPLNDLPGEIRPDDKGKDRKSGLGELNRKEHYWSELSEEDRTRLRDALRQVWSDPAVINAREEVKEATDAYQSAMRGAVQRVDPSMAEALFTLQKIVEGETRDKLGGPAGFPGTFPRKGEEYPTHPPGFLERLTPDQRERWKSIEERTRETPEVQAALRSLEEIRKQDEELRRRRLEAHRQVRESMMAELALADPEFAAMMERWQKLPSKGLPGDPRGSEGKASRERQDQRPTPLVPPPLVPTPPQ